MPVLIILYLTKYQFTFKHHNGKNYPGWYRDNNILESSNLFLRLRKKTNKRKVIWERREEKTNKRERKMIWGRREEKTNKRKMIWGRRGEKTNKRKIISRST
jgi:hypothetical protein